MGEFMNGEQCMVLTGKTRGGIALYRLIDYSYVLINKAETGWFDLDYEDKFLYR